MPCPSTPRPAMAALLALATLGGCSTFPLTTFEDRYPMREGWHRATVDRIVPADAVPALLRPACPGGMPAAQADARQWLLLDYRPAGRARQAAAPLPPQAGVAPGAAVYLRVQDCQREVALPGALR